MNRLNELLQELGISKVNLAKYLGVSRQMVYNYLELDDLNKWPKEKKLLLFKLFNIEDGSEESLNNIKVTTEYLMAVEQRLNQSFKEKNNLNDFFDLNGMNKQEQQLISDIACLIKEKLTEDANKEQNFYAITYLYQMLQSMDNVPEVKYILGYMSKTTGFTDPEDFKFEADRQFIFEGILYSALNLYNSGGASRSRLAESHKRFVQEIQKKNEEKITRTQQLNIIKIQALRELGYNNIDDTNASEVIEKMAEIESRKV